VPPIALVEVSLPFGWIIKISALSLIVIVYRVLGVTMTFCILIGYGIIPQGIASGTAEVVDIIRGDYICGMDMHIAGIALIGCCSHDSAPIIIKGWRDRR